MCTFVIDRPVKDLNSQEFDFTNEDDNDLNLDFTEEIIFMRKYNKSVKIIDLKGELNNFMADSNLSSYSVKVDEIKKDYLSGMLRQLLEISPQISIKEIRLTCLNDIPSLQIITNNNGTMVKSLRNAEKTADTYIVKI